MQPSRHQAPTSTRPRGGSDHDWLGHGRRQERSRAREGRTRGSRRGLHRWLARGVVRRWLTRSGGGHVCWFLGLSPPRLDVEPECRSIAPKPVDDKDRNKPGEPTESDGPTRRYPGAVVSNARRNPRYPKRYHNHHENLHDTLHPCLLPVVRFSRERPSRAIPVGPCLGGRLAQCASERPPGPSRGGRRASRLGDRGQRVRPPLLKSGLVAASPACRAKD